MNKGNSTTSVQSLTGLGDKMINVIASISVKASERDAFIEIFKANVPKVLEKEGCVEYSAKVDFQTDIPIQETNANVVTVIEKWESLPHL
ncbi:MAG: antibiotic biosynthesis monooxygenase, partial [Pirellulales bacterium]|nr:antibiotic biosynthesis monooxygenase [Pirellulales bacterium]